MISFVENKKFNQGEIKSLLKLSEQKNHWSNYGPVSSELESEIARRLGLNDDYAVVACCSGTLALYCLVNLYNFINERQLKWAVSSYGFPCCNQGPLMNSVVVDCDQDGMLDLDLLDKIKFDGIIVTNIFGTQKNLNKYRDYCKSHKKIFIADSATCFADNKENEIISFHHTKPWGFGEGGCLIVEKKYEKKIRSVANFGLTTAEKIGKWGMNAKISDVGAAFILQRINQMDQYEGGYWQQYLRIKQIGEKLGYKVMGECVSIPAHVPLLNEKPTYQIDNEEVVLKKYYKPLAETPVANNLYSRMVNFPCHKGVSKLSDRCIRNILSKIK